MPVDKVTTRKRKHSDTIQTRHGRFIRVGTNVWGKALIKCPQCGAPAVVDATREIWCRVCGFTSAGLLGCT